MNDRYILILGAGLMQRPSIEAAKELGYKALVIDANPDAVCVPFADRFEKIDLKDIVLETDSPFLSPEPYRGKKNKPCNVLYVAKRIAEIKNISLEEVINTTTTTAKQIFDIS